MFRFKEHILEASLVRNKQNLGLKEDDIIIGINMATSRGHNVYLEYQMNDMMNNFQFFVQLQSGQRSWKKCTSRMLS